MLHAMHRTSNCAAGLCGILRGDRVTWGELGVSEDVFLDTCRHHELSSLVHAYINRLAGHHDWPDAVRNGLSRTAHAETACEMLRYEEIVGVIAALTGAGVRPVLLKGTALAYTVYDKPNERPRLDTDLLIDEHHRVAARTALERLGYNAPPYCADLLSQFEMSRTDHFGLTHVVDVHWRISTQAVFAYVLTYDEVRPRAVPLSALGDDALTLCGVDALLLACLHPVMHHQNEERLLWIYDIHLIAAGLKPHEFEEFAQIARTRKMSAVCARGLRLAQTMFNAPIPPGMIQGLGTAGTVEPSAGYLASERRWHHETIASLRALPGIRDRVRMLRDVLLPSPSYMLGVYGVRGKPLAPWLLPALYVHRNLRGAWKILAGKK
jgi:hypothetical protein